MRDGIWLFGESEMKRNAALKADFLRNGQN